MTKYGRNDLCIGKCRNIYTKSKFTTYELKVKRDVIDEELGNHNFGTHKLSLRPHLLPFKTGLISDPFQRKVHLTRF